jgi:hypothetical protein
MGCTGNDPEKKIYDHYPEGYPGKQAGKRLGRPTVKLFRQQNHF